MTALLAAYRDGDVRFGALVRGLTLYDAWYTPGDPSGAVLTRETAEGPWLDLFVDRNELTAHLDAIPQDRTLRPTRLRGDVLASLDDGLAGLRLLPGRAAEVRLDRDACTEARGWAQSALIEAMLVGRRPMDLTTLRDWRGWQVLLGRGGTQLTLTTDAEGRPLAAVFTADDCREAFVARVPEQLRGSLEVRRMMGAQLFAQLLYLPVQGAAFNPAGPVPRRAFDKQLLESVVRHVDERN